MESLKLTCYSGERCRAGGTLAGTALLDLYATAEIAASIRHVPTVTIVTDTPGRIPAAFAIIDELTAQRGLVTSEAVQVVRVPAAGRRDEPG